MTNQVIYQARCGDSNPQRYELVKHFTDNVYGCGRPGVGVQFKSDPHRRLISDEWQWFEGADAEAKCDAFIASLVG